MRLDMTKLETEIAKTNKPVPVIAESSGLCKATVYAIIGGKSCTRSTATCLAAGLGIPLASLLPDKEQ